MIDKIISINTDIEITQDNIKTTIGRFNSSISDGTSNININLQVYDKEKFASNVEAVKKQYIEFEKELKKEAVNRGWKIFETETTIA